MAGIGFKIGTRGSPLALWQANEVASRLRKALNVPEDAIELVIIRPSGDMSQAGGQALVGGKGAFTKEIDEAMLAGDIDLAVHSAKDMPTAFPDGIDIIGYLPREDVRDCLISAKYKSIEELPLGGIVGTASLRRAALVKRIRPDIKTQVLRGNVDTRIRKSAEGEVDATLLALAGLKRLAAERTFLKLLDGSCRTPIAGHAVINGDQLTFHGLYLSNDGRQSFTANGSGSVNDAALIGEKAARDILAVLPPDIRMQGE